MANDKPTNTEHDFSMLARRFKNYGIVTTERLIHAGVLTLLALFCSPILPSAWNFTKASRQFDTSVSSFSRLTEA